MSQTLDCAFNIGYLNTRLRNTLRRLILRGFIFAYVDSDIFHENLFSRLPNMCLCYCEETKISFKITETEIDNNQNQYRACKCNYFSHVKHSDMILEICFSIPKTKDILQF